MRTVYHEFESLEHLLTTRLLPGGDHRPIRFVVFGGTGAVGGAAVVELVRMILMARDLGRGELRGEVWATGLGDKEISKFVSRLYMAFEEDEEIEKIEPLRHYRLAGRIDLRFDVLRLQLPSDLPEHVAEKMESDPDARLEQVLGEYFATQACPFLGFVEKLDDEFLHSVVVAIPLPSVATYTLTTVDRLVAAQGLDHATGQRIKKSYLRTFIQGLATIQQRHARHVVMAHTTAVGGMYRVDGGSSQIRLGFAHSALGKKLVDKKFFADELTQLFVDHGFDVLVTAAAIGIDAVDFRCQLPSDRAVVSRMRERGRTAEHQPWAEEDLSSGRILLYPFETVRIERAPEPPVAESRASSAENTVADDGVSAPEAAADPASAKASTDANTKATTTADRAGTEAEGREAEPENTAENTVEREADTGEQAAGTAEVPAAVRYLGQGVGDLGPGAIPAEAQGGLYFGRGKELLLPAAIRSGENGLFSVANCVALYHVMKVAIPEELAMVLVRHAVFGPERRRDWFDDKISYYTETENSYFALRLLDSYPQLLRAHHGAFAVQAYQALGSSTHQARLHELSLLMLLLRLRELAVSFRDIPEAELVAALQNLDDFFWHRTRIPSFEDLDDLEPAELAANLGRLCEVDSMEAAGRLIGYDPRLHAVRQPGREKFLHRVSTYIQRHLQTITSLGIPILYRGSDGQERCLVGPYVAPLDTAIAHRDDLPELFEQLADRYETPVDAFRDWTVANNGFVDLRPHAIGSAVQEPGPGMEEHVRRLRDGDELRAWLDSMTPGSYFTCAGVVALHYRLTRLGHRVRQRKVELGTRETWKHLFRQDRRGRHLISPGLVETVRMYNEGLGKITGTEALWPSWGY